jgi:tetratricopeptide (TPR) repeat protein
MRGVGLFTVVFFCSANVWAADLPSDEVKAQVRKATAEYNLGQYSQAARDYEAAYLQTLDDNLLFNVAQAYRLGGDIDKAITAYRSYLRSSPHGDQRALAQAKLRELEDKRAAAPVALTPAAIAAPAPPLASSTQAPPAPPASEPNVLVAAPSPAPAPSAPFYKRWPFWVAGGVLVAGGAVAAILLSRGGDDLRMPNATLGTKEY